MFQCKITLAQPYPTFGAEIPVTINGLSFDAMEPFISGDGNTLFFNSLNAGGNTNLYYAAKVNDSTFNYTGQLSGTLDTSSSHLDAVASLDSTNRFYWVSLRNYPAVIQNLHSGFFDGNTVSAVKRVYGDFNIPIIGWIIMDAAINYQANELYYCNAYFDFINNSCGIGIPCNASIGVAQKVNDSTFNKLPDTDAIFSAINDTNYLVYAPQVSTDGLELYYTRLLKNTFNTEVCVAVRSNNTANFSMPQVIQSNNGFVPEGPTISIDKQKLYYHQKDAFGIHKIFLRYRINAVSLSERVINPVLKIFPLPASNFIYLNFDESKKEFTVKIYTINGSLIYESINQNKIDLSVINDGTYFIKVTTQDAVYVEKLIKQNKL